MKKGIAIIICAMMILLSGCGSSNKEVTIALGEVGTVNLDIFDRQEGIKSIRQENDDLTVTVTKDGSYYFNVIDESGKEIKVVMTVQKEEVSVKTEDGTDVSFTINK